MLAKVVEAAPGRIVAEIGEGEHRQAISVEQRFYNNVDHGYATTIHKSQGATVDRVKVLASLSLDRHLTYVAMTRHREDLGVYYGRGPSPRRAAWPSSCRARTPRKRRSITRRVPSIAQALRFAEARGLHHGQCRPHPRARPPRLDRRQKQKLVNLTARLATIGAQLGRKRSNIETSSKPVMEARPMVSGITTFPKSIDQAVEDRLLPIRV
jgi:ATP-dependent exoDNAse (exonuclease V) beta subunit